MPGSGDSASVNNGGTATAAAGITANSLLIGMLSGATSSAAGTVVVNSGDVVSGTPVVGQTVSAGVGASATGSLTIANGDLLQSTVFAFGLTGGQNFQSDGAANGMVAIPNGSILLGNVPSNPILFIGVANGGTAKSGTATGVVSAQAIDTSANALQSALIGFASMAAVRTGHSPCLPQVAECSG